MEEINGTILNMAKRFTDSDKYKKPFFRGLKGPYKLLWDYLYHDCDNAGIWIKDFEIAQLYLGSDMVVNEQDALKNFGDRIIVFEEGSKWFIPGFIEFQYDCTINTLNPKNNAHLSVIKKLTKMGLMSPLSGAKDKDKDEDKDLDKDESKYITVENEKIFDVMPMLEVFEAALNGRQREHGTRNWRDVVSEWFETVLEIDFNDGRHVFNTFSKYLINTKKPNGTFKTIPKVDLTDL